MWPVGPKSLVSNASNGAVIRGKGKGKAGIIAVHGTLSHSYGVSLAIRDHSVLPATQVT